MVKPGRANADRRQHLKRYYGLTENDYQAILEQQNGGCAICGFIPKEGEYRLCVDHSHSSLKIRGLLCHYCNIALGRFKDSPKIIKAALVYLTRKVNYGKVKFTRIRYSKRRSQARRTA